MLLDGLGARFSPDYVCFDADGRVVESGRLAEEPHYAVALRLASEYAGKPGFAEFAAQSSDVQSTNAALRAGSRPENLVAAPAATFLEPPTEEGFMVARRHLMNLIKVPPAVAEKAVTRKPWWRFW